MQFTSVISFLYQSYHLQFLFLIIFTNDSKHGTLSLDKLLMLYMKIVHSLTKGRNLECLVIKDVWGFYLFAIKP